jgi:hypothetical protein
LVSGLRAGRRAPGADRNHHPLYPAAQLQVESFFKID